MGRQVGDSLGLQVRFKIRERLQNRTRHVGEALSLPKRRSRLGSPERGAGSPNGLTEGFFYSVDEQTPPPHVRSAPPLPGEAWALRAGGEMPRQREAKSLPYRVRWG